MSETFAEILRRTSRNENKPVQEIRQIFLEWDELFRLSFFIAVEHQFYSDVTATTVNAIVESVQPPHENVWDAVQAMEFEGEQREIVLHIFYSWTDQQQKDMIQEVERIHCALKLVSLLSNSRQRFWKKELLTNPTNALVDLCVELSKLGLLPSTPSAY